MNRLKGKVCLVTGSTEGIGYSIAQRLGEEGGIIFIVSRKEENVQKAVKSLSEKGIKCYGKAANLNSSDARRDIVNLIGSTYGFLDILVCNVAASTHFGRSIDIEEKSFDKMMEVNIKGTFFMIKEAYTLLKKGNSPAITIISSYAGYMPILGIGVYSITKTALLGMTKLLAEELSTDNIRVNCVAPGVVKTKFAAGIITNEKIASNFQKRVSNPDEISGTVAFLSSNDASFITGETIAVTGGYHARL